MFRSQVLRQCHQLLWGLKQPQESSWQLPIHSNSQTHLYKKFFFVLIITFKLITVGCLSIQGPKPLLLCSENTLQQTEKYANVETITRCIRNRTILESSCSHASWLLYKSIFTLFWHNLSCFRCRKMLTLWASSILFSASCCLTKSSRPRPTLPLRT